MPPLATRDSRVESVTAPDTRDDRRVWITRTEPGASRSATAIAALGWTPVVAPLLRVESVPIRDWLGSVTDLAFSSVHAVTNLVNQAQGRFETLKSLPVWCVGDRTAQAALDAGFTDVTSADGDLSSLGELVRDHAATDAVILYPGAEIASGTLQAGLNQRVHAVAAYRTVPTAVPPPADCRVVLLYSARAARALAACVQGPVRDRLRIVALSRAVAEGLNGTGPEANPFGRIDIAARPDEAALLAALGQPTPPS